MAIRVLWDEKETAVLVDYYMRFVRSEISRSQAVQGASAELRDLAVRNGIPIDEKFRNESGIAMQMVKIEDYYTGQKKRLRKAPQVFYDVVDMYTNDYKTFKNLLKEAREAKENNDGESVEEEYKRWLSETLSLSATQISKFYYVYPEIESYFQQTGILTKALFKTTDIPVIGKIRSLMGSDRNYAYWVRMQINKRKGKKSRRERREQEKEQLEKQKTAINYYYNFLTEKNTADEEGKEYEPEGRQEEAPNSNQEEFHSSGTEDAPVSFTVKGSEEVFPAVENEDAGDKEKTGTLKKPNEDTASEDSIVHAADGRTDAFENAEEETHPKLSEEEKVEKTHEDDPTGEGPVEEEASDPTIATGDASPVEDIVPADDNVPAGSPAQSSEVASQSVKNNENLLCVDFRGKETYYFTYPDKLIYFGKEYEVSKWPQAIALTARCLYKDYPDFIASVKNRYKGQYISDAAGTARMKASQKIADDLFVETQMDSTSAVSRIRYFLDVCGVAYENIAIFYHSVVDSDPPVKRDPKVGAAEKPDEKIKIAVAERIEKQEGTGDEPSAEKQKATGGEIRAEVQKEDPLISYLQEKGAEYIDDRSKGGSLWILGGYEIIRLIMDCREKFGVYFASRYGAKELNGRNGWKLYDRQTKKEAPKRKVSVKVQETKVPETSGEVKVPYRSTDSYQIKTEGSDSSAVTTDAETLDTREIKKEGSETQRWLSEAELMEFEASSFKVTSRGEFTVWLLSEDKEAQDRLSAEDAAYNIKLCEVIASQNGWKDAKLYDVNYKRAAETARQMLADPKINGEQNSNRKWVYRTLIKFLRYLAAGSDVKKKETEIPRKKEDSISHEETAVSADSALQPERGAEASSDEGKEEQSQFTSKEKTGMVSAELSVRESSVLEEKKGSAESSAESKDEIIEGISLDSSKSTENSSESLQQGMRLDFSSEKAYYGSTCPDTLVYFGRKYAVISWTRLLVQIVRCLYEDYPAAILSLRDNKLISHVTDRNGKSRLTAPKQIAEDVYIERSLSATNIVKRIKYYLDFCKVNYNDIVILYHSTGSDSDSEKTEIDKEGQLISEERESVLTEALSEEKTTDTDPFIAFLQEKQVRYIDNRDQGGNLWVIGDYELKDFINECSATYNVRFRFRYRADEINRRNGWQLYYPKTYEELARKSVSAKIEDVQEEIKEPERQGKTPEAKLQESGNSNCLTEDELMKFEASATKLTSSEEFMNWMLTESDERLEKSKANTYVTAIQLCGMIAVQKGYGETRFFNVSYRQAAETARQLLSDPEINGPKKTSRSWLRDPLIKFLLYLAFGSYTGQAQEQVETITHSQDIAIVSEIPELETEREEIFDEPSASETYNDPNAKNNFLVGSDDPTVTAVVKEDTEETVDKEINSISVIKGVEQDSTIPREDGELKNTEKLPENWRAQIRPDFTQEKISCQFMRPQGKYTEEIKKILEKRYPYGFRIGPQIELIRFRNYAEQDSMDLPESDEELSDLIKRAGVLIDGKVIVIGQEVLHRLTDLLNEVFDGGARVLFVEPFMTKNAEWLEEHYITSSDMFKKILSGSCPEFYCGKNLITKGERLPEKEAVVSEIQRVSETREVVKISEISNSLPYIPEDKIAYYMSAGEEFVRISDGKYFVMRYFSVEEDEAAAIWNFAAKECDEKGYASMSDLPLGEIPDRNYELSDGSLYNAVYIAVLKKDFKLDSKILSRNSDKGTDIISLLKNYCRGKSVCTLREVMDQSVSLVGTQNRQYCYMALYDTKVRVDDSTFVSDEQVNFHIVEIDRLLHETIGDRFGPIKSVTSFALFPPCGKEWNHYLLESFCYRFSKDFMLCVKNYNNKNAGIIAVKTLKLSYDEMLCEYAADSDVPLTEEPLKQYFYERGLLSKRKFAGMPELIEKAVKLREEG